MKAAILAFMLLLGWIAPASASFIAKGSGISVSKSGNSATFTRQPGGTYSDASDFEALLKKPGFAMRPGEVSDFERLLDQPHKPTWERDPEKSKVKHKTPISSTGVAKALRGGVVPYLGGILLAELLEKACVRLAGGTMQMAEHGQWQECVQGEPQQPSQGYFWRTNHLGLFRATKAEACIDFLNSWKSGQPTASVGGIQISETPGAYGSCRFPYQTPYLSGVAESIFIRGSATACAAGQYQWSDGTCHAQPQVSDVEWRDISHEDAESKIKEEIEKPGNGPKVVEAIRDYLDKGGEIEPAGPSQVTGPAQSSPSSTTTTSTSTDPGTGQTTTTTTTTTTVNNYTYNNTTVINNQTTTTTKTDQDGKIVESHSTTTNPTDKEEPPPTDTPLPEIPKLYERKYPDGMKGIWNEKSQAIKQTPLFNLASQLMPSGMNGGSCPSWQIPLDMAGFHNWGVADVSPPCWIWDFGKAVVLIGALILARALIFGG